MNIQQKYLESDLTKAAENLGVETDLVLNLYKIMEERDPTWHVHGTKKRTRDDLKAEIEAHMETLLNK